MPSLIRALKGIPFSSAILVFDAGSADGSQDYVKRLAAEHPELPIHLITPNDPTRNSFAEGCNQAIEHAAARFPELVWCLFYETDNQFLDHTALAKSIRFLESRPSLGGVGFTVEHLNGQKIGYGCRFPSPLSFALGQQLTSHIHLDEPPSKVWHLGSSGERWQLCDVVYTSPLLIRLQTWKESGPMNAQLYPFTDSDVEWCWRAKQMGWPMATLDLPGVVHDNAGAMSQWSSRRVLWFHQSRMRLVRQLHPVRARLVRPLLFVRHVFEIIILATKAPRSTHARKSMQTRFKLLKGVWSGYESVIDS